MKKRCGHSSVGRATASQAVGRGFEPLCPLCLIPANSQEPIANGEEPTAKSSFLSAIACCLLVISCCVAGCLTPTGREDKAGDSGTDDSMGFEPFSTAGTWSQPKPDKPEGDKVYHVVVEGDTLWRIAKAYGIEQEEIMKANNLTSSNVQVGQKLLIPGATETVEVKRYRPPRPGKKFVLRESFGYPCVGRLAIGFGQLKNGQKTEGVEFAVGRGSRAVASRTGEVVLVARAFPGYGVVVILQHGPQYRTFYGYLAQTPLQVGDAVAKGEILGVTGLEPGSGKARLHFRTYEGTKAVDPLGHLR